MIIDEILDVLDGLQTNKKDSRRYIVKEALLMGNMGYIVEAYAYSDEKKVKSALIRYVKEQDYNPAIAERIKGHKWL